MNLPENYFSKNAHIQIEMFRVLKQLILFSLSMTKVAHWQKQSGKADDCLENDYVVGRLAKEWMVVQRKEFAHRVVHKSQNWQDIVKENHLLQFWFAHVSAFKVVFSEEKIKSQK